MPETSMRLWLFALGYFAAYVPYAALTKAMSSGAFSGPVVSGLALLPLSLMASVLSMLAVFSFGGYWRFASTRRLLGRDVPMPSRTTLLAGTATAAIIVTTTLSYAFVGVNISLMSLLMRGGVLLLAPLVDAITGRKVWWYSWVALALGLVAVLGLSGQAKANLPWLAALDIACYLGAYLIRLLIMSRAGKQVTQRERMRYFVEEQLVASPMALIKRRLRRSSRDGPGVASVMLDAFSITQDRIARSRLAGDPPDVLVNARLESFGLFDFHRGRELIALGRETARRKLPDILEHSSLLQTAQA